MSHKVTAPQPLQATLPGDADAAWESLLTVFVPVLDGFLLVGVERNFARVEVTRVVPVSSHACGDITSNISAARDRERIQCYYAGAGLWLNQDRGKSLTNVGAHCMEYLRVGKSPRMINNSRKRESGVPGVDLPRSGDVGDS